MKPVKKRIIVLNKASDSTTSDNTLANTTTVAETGTQINNNTKTMASMMNQMNSTKSIMIIAVAGIVAYFIFKSKK